MKRRIFIMISLVTFIIGTLFFLKWEKESSIKVLEEIKLPNTADDSLSLDHDSNYVSLSNKDYPSFYENLIFTDDLFSPYLLKMEGKDTVHEKFPHFDKKRVLRITVKDSMSCQALQAFARIHIVNQWYSWYLDTYHITEESMICNRIRNAHLFYCGNLKISNSFSSYMFLLRTEAYEHFKEELYVINLCNDTITSVSRLFHVLDSHASGLSDYSYSVLMNDRKFQTYYVDLTPDLFDSEGNDLNENPYNYGTFSFDDKGRILVLE